MEFASKLKYYRSKYENTFIKHSFSYCLELTIAMLRQLINCPIINIIIIIIIIINTLVTPMPLKTYG